MISEGSCDTVDWSNGCCFALTEINYILKDIQIGILNCNIISQYYCFCCVFDQMNVALMIIRDF